MGAILKLLILIVFMVILPVLSGAAVCFALKARAAGSGGKIRLSSLISGETVFSGYYLSFILCEFTALPVLFFTHNGRFIIFAVLWTAVMCLTGASGLAVILWQLKKAGPVLKRPDGETKAGEKLRNAVSDPVAVLLAAAAVLLWLFMLYMAYTRASFDGDDAYYVTQSVLAVQTGLMYRYLPYTGITTTVDLRHAMALFPMWTAVLSKDSGMHPTIIAHSMEPLLFITLSAFTYFRISGILFGRKDGDADSAKEVIRKRAAFMILLFLFWIFGNVSIYTPETFLLTRTWQGKSVLANLLIPGCFYCLLRAGTDPDEIWPYAESFLILLSSGLFTSMAPVMLFVFMAAGSLITAAVKKRAAVFVRFIPAMAAACIYIVLLLTV